MNIFFVLCSVVIFAVLTTSFLLYAVYESGKAVGRYQSPYAIKRHRLWVDRFFCAVVVSVLLIEAMLFTKRGVSVLDTPLGVTHIMLDIIFVILVVTMRWFITGEKNKELHRKISKVVFGNYLCILITGIWLLVRLVGQV
jgi:uncharacterized membrane protein YozB (DUF420 family)